MDFWSAIDIGLKEIWAHKFRSFLTMLGIILGVSSLVAMSALVKGMEIGAREALIAIGGLEKVRIEPQEVPVEQRYLEDEAVGVTLNDVYALRRNAPLVAEISPEMQLPRATVTAHGKRFRPFICSGVWPVALDMNEHVIAHGRMFNEIDEEQARSVCVIGTETRDQIFGSPEDVGHEIIPLGRTININGQPFTIIGMFPHYMSEEERKERAWEKLHPKKSDTGPKRSKGWSHHRGSFIYWLKNATIYIPLTTMWIKFRSGAADAPSGDPALTSLEIKVRSLDVLNPALQQVRNVLMRTHKGIEDFTFRTQEDWADRIQQFIHNARMSGGTIAGIALIVGGIGIMNIMLASISGRIREIGIRKAVGASTVDIFIQIVVESLVLSVLGGLIGLAASYGLVQLIAALSPTENAPVITFTALAVAFGFSVCIGILAGLFPAIKAARLDPILALRYE